MSENRNRQVINAERVIINADEVIVIEANDHRRHRRNNPNDVASMEDRRNHRDDDVFGIQEEHKRRRFPW